MRIGIAQVNTTVGDLSGNLVLAIDAYEQLCGKGVDLVVFSELLLSGYPPRDLLLKENFLDDIENTLREFAKHTGPVPALIGYAERISQPSSFRRAYNSVAWCESGNISQNFRKRLIPTYDVFDEDRYFSRGELSMTRNFKGKKIAVSICEDIWNINSSLHAYNPLDQIRIEKPDILFNLSASPWHEGKQEQRVQLLTNVATQLGCPVCYVNAIGGNDELIFDGRSMVVDSEGNVLKQASAFNEAICVCDFNEIAISDTQISESSYSLRKALVLGLRDYVFKTGFTKCLIGLSGGIDSAVTAALAVEALGAENVIGVSLPSAISSEHSKEDASQLARNLEIEFHTLPITNIVNSSNLTLTTLFAGKEEDVTEENLQARSRGLLLMAISNKFGALLLTTGNKSELAVGYCTLYGDMCGGLAVIADVPKTQVFALARHINRHAEIIPQNTIDKPPSAELRPDQKDSDSLPEYDQLDEILHAYVEEGKSIQTIISLGHQEDVVRKIIRLVDNNEHKRKQAAPALKTTKLAFGVGRRMPIVQKYQN